MWNWTSLMNVIGMIAAGASAFAASKPTGVDTTDKTNISTALSVIEALLVTHAQVAAGTATGDAVAAVASSTTQAPALPVIPPRT